MKLKKLLKTIDLIITGKTTIWGSDEEIPLWEGEDAFDIPWWIANLKINYNTEDEPVRFYHYRNEYGVNMLGMVISVIE